MRKIELSTAFKKDLKALRHTGVKPLVDFVITLLQNDKRSLDRARGRSWGDIER
jgi:mRNA-degrading endonuclease RelE of RelBE toxin-antitoxin system